MIRQERLDKLKEYEDPDKSKQFYNALLCEINIVVKQHREVFDAKARDFDKKCLEYGEAWEKAIDWTAVEAAIKKATEARRDERESRRVHCTTPDKPPEGPYKTPEEWKRIDTEISKDGLLFPWHFWAPPDFPDDPVRWFDVYKPNNYGGLGEFIHMLYPKSIRQLEDELLRDYVVLTVLYNKQAEERGEIPISPEVLSGIEIPVECETLLEKQTWSKVRNSLMDALEAVNNDLASTNPAETEQNAAPVKGGWIGNFFWKLYEKTLKVIVDAVLEKWWPK